MKRLMIAAAATAMTVGGLAATAADAQYWHRPHYRPYYGHGYGWHHGWDRRPVYWGYHRPYWRQRYYYRHW